MKAQVLMLAAMGALAMAMGPDRMQGSGNKLMEDTTASALIQVKPVNTTEVSTAPEGEGHFRGMLRRLGATLGVTPGTLEAQTAAAALGVTTEASEAQTAAAEYSIGEMPDVCPRGVPVLDKEECNAAATYFGKVTGGNVVFVDCKEAASNNSTLNCDQFREGCFQQTNNQAVIGYSVMWNEEGNGNEAHRKDLEMNGLGLAPICMKTATTNAASLVEAKTYGKEAKDTPGSGLTEIKLLDSTEAQLQKPVIMSNGDSPCLDESPEPADPASCAAAATELQMSFVDCGKKAGFCSGLPKGCVVNKHGRINDAGDTEYVVWNKDGATRGTTMGHYYSPPICMQTTATNTTSLAEAKAHGKEPKDTTASALSEIKPVNQSEEPTMPPRKKVVGNSPAAQQFAAKEALKQYYLEAAFNKTRKTKNYTVNQVQDQSSSGDAQKAPGQIVLEVPEVVEDQSSARDGETTLGNSLLEVARVVKDEASLEGDWGAILRVLSGNFADPARFTDPQSYATNADGEETRDMLKAVVGPGHFPVPWSRGTSWTHIASWFRGNRLAQIKDIEDEEVYKIEHKIRVKFSGATTTESGTPVYPREAAAEQIQKDMRVNENILPYNSPDGLGPYYYYGPFKNTRALIKSLRDEGPMLASVHKRWSEVPHLLADFDKFLDEYHVYNFFLQISWVGWDVRPVLHYRGKEAEVVENLEPLRTVSIMLVLPGNPNEFAKPENWAVPAEADQAKEIEKQQGMIGAIVAPGAFPFPWKQSAYDRKDWYQKTTKEETPYAYDYQDIKKLEADNPGESGYPRENAEAAIKRDMKPNGNKPPNQAGYYYYGPFKTTDGLLEGLKRDEEMLASVKQKWSEPKKASHLKEFDAFLKAFKISNFYLQVSWVGWRVRPVLEYVGSPEVVEAQFEELQGRV